MGPILIPTTTKTQYLVPERWREGERERKEKRREGEANGALGWG